MKKHAPKRRIQHENTLRKFIVARGHDIGLDMKTITGPSRKKHLVEFRRDIARRARNAGFYLTEIGRVMNRDHSTIRHLIMNNGHGE